eukprot:15364442-Ditylum_brightwellii.AAC.1
MLEENAKVMKDAKANKTYLCASFMIGDEATEKEQQEQQSAKKVSFCNLPNFTSPKGHVLNTEIKVTVTAHLQEIGDPIMGNELLSTLGPTSVPLAHFTASPELSACIISCTPVLGTASSASSISCQPIHDTTSSASSVSSVSNIPVHDTASSASFVSIVLFTAVHDTTSSASSISHPPVHDTASASLLLTASHHLLLLSFLIHLFLTLNLLLLLLLFHQLHSEHM